MPGGRSRGGSARSPRGGRSFNLPNVIGSPHNSAIVAGSLTEAAAHAADNVARHLRGEPIRNLVNLSDYVA